jgi:hypothetical protein
MVFGIRGLAALVCRIYFSFIVAGRAAKLTLFSAVIILIFQRV